VEDPSSSRSRQSADPATEPPPKAVQEQVNKSASVMEAAPRTLVAHTSKATSSFNLREIPTAQLKGAMVIEQIQSTSAALQRC